MSLFLRMAQDRLFGKGRGKVFERGWRPSPQATPLCAEASPFYKGRPRGILRWGEEKGKRGSRPILDYRIYFLSSLV